MAITQAMTTSFKAELMLAVHDFRLTSGDSFKLALYTSSATIDANTTAYTSSNEVTGTNYTAGGVTVTNTVVPTTSGTTAYWTPSASVTYTNVTLSTSFDCVLIYNSTQSNRAVAAYTFGSQTITAGTFTLLMPTNAAGTALINFA